MAFSIVAPAPVVVSGGVLRVDLDRPGEVGDGGLVLPQVGVGKPPVVVAPL